MQQYNSLYLYNIILIKILADAKKQIGNKKIKESLATFDAELNLEIQDDSSVNSS